MTHKYEISSMISKEVFNITFDDNQPFHYLFTKVCTFIGISEKWHFGLFYHGNHKIWINLRKDVHSSIKYFPKIPSVTIQLTLEILSYPMSLFMELWRSATVHFFFMDILHNSENSNFNKLRTIETDAIEALLCQRQSDIDFSIFKREIQTENEQQLNAKVEEFHDLTEWELQKKYFEILDNSKFVRVTGKFKCNDGSTTATMTVNNLIIVHDCNRTEYEWCQIDTTLKGPICVISSYSSDKPCKKKKLEFDSEDISKQFYHLFYEHKTQREVSSTAKIDAEFRYIEDLAKNEQKSIEEIRSLKSLQVKYELVISELKENNVNLESKISRLRNTLEIKLDQIVDNFNGCNTKEMTDKISQNEKLLTEIEYLRRINEEIKVERAEKSEKLKEILKEKEALEEKVHKFEIIKAEQVKHRCALEIWKKRVNSLSNEKRDETENDLRKQIEILNILNKNLQIEKDAKVAKYKRKEESMKMEISNLKAEIENYKSNYSLEERDIQSNPREIEEYCDSLECNKLEAECSGGLYSMECGQLHCDGKSEYLASDLGEIKNQFLVTPRPLEDY